MAELFSKITAEIGGDSPYEFMGITSEGGNSFVISNDRFYSGENSYKIIFDGINDQCYGRKDFSETDTIYYISKIYIPSTFNMSDGYQWLMSIADGNTYLAHLRLRRASGYDSPNTLSVLSRTGASGNITGLSKDVWLDCKIWWKSATSGNSDGELKIWIGESLVYDYSHSTGNLPDNIRVGTWDSAAIPTEGSYIYWDELEGYDTIPSGGSSLPAIINNYRQQGVM